MDNSRHRLDITWAKAFGEAYCHHASLFIPFVQESLLDAPELVKIGVTVRYNTVKGRKIISTSCSDFQEFLPCAQTDGGLIAQLNSSQLIEAISLNSWTSLKNGKRGTQKEFPTRIFYTIGDKDPVELSFSPTATPYWPPKISCPDYPMVLNSTQQSISIYKFFKKVLQSPKFVLLLWC